MDITVAGDAVERELSLISEAKKDAAIKVFVSYFHNDQSDEELWKTLEAHLSSRIRKGAITVWHVGQC
ncbi:hypothetical protein IQ268_07170 [Oculatella sp. LEGE 06141]|uniref:hypothetical protein n=1 Tax=Oculatella sp. LEGE 06141 TaxID=1828648 RepID=UPI00187F7E1A|nr:hypothetical protein [Oculatella sp. LEGE 06141]MBE9178367.1 hypothetical protein [Oculatella sp. LEGE 06141]